MANIYILTGSFEDASDAWVQFVSSSNKTELILGESGSEELISSIITVPPILTQEEVDNGADTGSIPYVGAEYNIYNSQFDYENNIQNGTFNVEVSYMPNVSTASAEEIVNYCHINEELFVSLSLISISTPE